MNEMFIYTTIFLGIGLLLFFGVGAAVAVHLGFLVARWKSKAPAGYYAVIKKWFLKRALPLALLLSFMMTLAVALSAGFLASYRTRSIQQLANRPLMLKIYDETVYLEQNDSAAPIKKVTFSTTNMAIISEFLASIRFSPTYPNYGCLCGGDGRKFVLGKPSRDGSGLRPIESFTIHHDVSIRFANEWYGDWHLGRKSQTAFAAWIKKYEESNVSTNETNRIIQTQLE